MSDPQRSELAGTGPPDRPIGDEVVAAVVDAIPFPVLVKDEAFRLVAVNPAAESFLGLPASDVLGLTDFDLSPLEEAAHFRSRDELVMRTGAVDEVDEQRTDTGGDGVRRTLRTLRTRKSRLVLPDGRRFVIVAPIDISDLVESRRALEQQGAILAERTAELNRLIEELHAARGHAEALLLRAERERELLIRATEVAGHGYAVAEPDDRIGFCNEEFARALGIPLSRLEGERLDLLPTTVPWLRDDPGRETWIAAWIRAYREAGGAGVELAFPEDRWWQLRCRRGADGRTVACLIDGTAARVQAKALERLLREDDLTGVASRRHFLERLELECARSARYGRPCALAVADLDHFKSVNDRHGHAGGDAVLRHVATLWSAQVRALDLVGRLGGEEFAILFADTELDEAALVVERARATVAESPAPFGDTTIPTTASFGLADTTCCGPDPRRLLDLADRALYRAKALGRNRVELAMPAAASPPIAALGVAG